MIIRRLLSNILDLGLFLVTVILLFNCSGLEVTKDNGDFVSSLSFFLVFITPLLVTGNTIGKSIVKLDWQSSPHVRLKLIVKYFMYFSILLPSFSIPSAILSLPIFTPELVLQYQGYSVNLFIAIVITDVFVFVITLGRAHLLDYLFNLSLLNKTAWRNVVTQLAIIYMLVGSSFILSIYQYKYKFGMSALRNTLKSAIFTEHYPADLFYGRRVLVLRETTPDLVSPSVMTSILFPVNLRLKTLHIFLPDHAFISGTERYRVCKDLLHYSELNDLFRDDKPTQTRIVIWNIRNGKFLEKYTQYYTYYYDNSHYNWGLYGGISTDSISANNYAKFTENVMPNRVKRIEESTGLTRQQIADRMDKDNVFKKKIISELTSTVILSMRHNYADITMERCTLTLKKIHFDSTKPVGSMSYNYPIIDSSNMVYILGLFSDRISDLDPNHAYLIRLRDETTGKYL